MIGMQRKNRGWQLRQISKEWRVMGYALKYTSWLTPDPLAGIVEHSSLEGHFFLFIPHTGRHFKFSEVRLAMTIPKITALTALPRWRTRFIYSFGVSSISNKPSFCGHCLTWPVESAFVLYISGSNVSELVGLRPIRFDMVVHTRIRWSACEITQPIFKAGSSPVQLIFSFCLLMYSLF